MMTPRWLVGLVVGLATQVVQAQTAPVVSSEAQVAEEADSTPFAPSPPPELPQETPSAQPYPNAVWTSGHWYWDGSQWRIKPGAWVAAMPGYQFINGYWQQEDGGWRWVSGGWARPGSMEVEIPVEVSDEELATNQAPPPPQAETPPPQPAPNLTWAPGYWYWSGANWAWVGGTWLAAPRPGLVFVSPHWVRHGPSWLFVGGGWAAHGSVRVIVPVYRHAGIAVGWGHPNYFAHTWYRYPVVRHYTYGGRGWSVPAPHYHSASPVPQHGGDHEGGGHGGGGHGGGHHHH